MESESYDVIVVGGGITGVVTALTSARRDMNVCLLESRADLFKGVSRAGFGSLTPFSEPFFTGAARDMAALGTDLYRDDLLPWLREVTCQSVELCDKGLLELLDDATAIKQAESLVADLDASGHEGQGRIIDCASARELEPKLADDFEAALFLNEPWLDTHQLYAALAAAASSLRRLSLRLNTRAARVGTDGPNLAVVTTDGSVLRGKFVVLATGLGTGFPEGIRAPALECVRGDAVEVASSDGQAWLSRHIYRPLEGGANTFITPRSDGRLWLGATYELEAFGADSLPDPDRVGVTALLSLITRATRILPGLLENFEVSRTWRNWRPSTHDGFPIVGPSDGSGLLYATGGLGLGLTMAPAVADSIAHGIQTDDWARIPQQFDPLRPGGLADRDVLDGVFL